MFLIGSLPLFASDSNFPEIIDFGEFVKLKFRDDDKNAFRLGYFAFNMAPELGPFFASIRRDYHIDTVIETGTFKGGTAVLFSLLFDRVHTIEISQEFYQQATENLTDYPNVHCHLGSSEIVLREILPTLKDKPLIFYLDAHWENHWPLLEELEEISKTHKDNCIIVIDDFKVPGRKDIRYDKYGNHECSYNYIKDQLNKIYSAYEYHYLIPLAVKSKAKFVAIPKQWASELQNYEIKK